MAQSGFNVMNVQVPAGCNYTITGPDCQILNVTLKTGERVETEPGSMMFMSSGIKSSVECGNCSRKCAGEAICKSIYTNTDSADGFVSMTPNFPAKVIPVDLKNVKGKLIAKNGAYMGSIGEISTAVNFDCNPCTCCFGGLGCVRQQVSGTGTVFLAAGGTVLTKTLAANEKMIIDVDSVVGYEDSATLGMKRAGGCFTMCCGGEGLFVSTLKGPGTVYVQSMSFEKYKHAVAPAVNPAGKPKGGANTTGGH